jgi:hypothetical protein
LRIHDAVLAETGWFRLRFQIRCAEGENKLAGRDVPNPVLFMKSSGARVPMPLRKYLPSHEATPF